MSPFRSQRFWAVFAVCFVAGLALVPAYRARTRPAAFLLVPDRDFLPANGYAEARLALKPGGWLQASAITWQLEAGKNLAQLETSSSETRLRAGVTPGVVTVAAVAPGFLPSRVEIELGLDPADEFGDGTPDFLRLQDPVDRHSFRTWFTFLAEATYFGRDDERSPEVDDCAGLIRFAYHEALHRHDAAWASSLYLAAVPNIASVQKYEYPHTAMGAALFRTRPGGFAPGDLSDGTFAEFADAESLWRYNTHLVSRDLSAARPGDLLFFRQMGHRMPFHTMIYLGSSFFDGGSDWLIYHTGPSQNEKGEMRRVRVAELRAHPEFAWRPVAQNPSFLGVYRWNILREED